MIKKLIEFFIWRPLSFVLILIIKKRKFLCINVGCGPNILESPWLNFDYYLNKRIPLFIDINKKLPFNDETVLIINAEHVVEHISKTSQLEFFEECYRILDQGGCFSLIVPHADPLFSLRIKNKRKIISIYQDLNQDIVSYSDVCNNLYNSHGHKYIWFESDLIEQLYAAGFTRVFKNLSKEFEYQKIIIKASHYYSVGQKIDDFESLRILAFK